MEQHKCKRCGWEWYPRTPAIPVACPRCKSRYWDEEKEEIKNEDKPIEE